MLPIDFPVDNPILEIISKCYQLVTHTVNTFVTCTNLHLNLLSCHTLSLRFFYCTYKFVISLLYIQFVIQLLDHLPGSYHSLDNSMAMGLSRLPNLLLLETFSILISSCHKKCQYVDIPGIWNLNCFIQIYCQCHLLLHLSVIVIDVITTSIYMSSLLLSICYYWESLF